MPENLFFNADISGLNMLSVNHFHHHILSNVF